MAKDPQQTAQAAAQALKNPSFAQEVLEGKQDYPEVRDAILKDLAAANNQEVQAFVQGSNPTGNPQVLQNYIQNGPKPGGTSIADLAARSGAPRPDCW